LNDISATIAEYDRHTANFIRDARKALQWPNAFVIGQIGGLAEDEKNAA
jgi:hypothetical protein